MAARLVRRHGYDVVHARAHVAAAMGAVAKRLTGCRLIFDIRGFNPEEYVDAGVWPENGLNYRLAKRVERRLLAAADGFVVLTEKAPRHPLSRLFRFRQQRAAGRDHPLLRGPGSIRSRGRLAQGADSQGSWRRWTAGPGLCRRVGRFYLTEEMAEFLAVAQRQDASTFSVILTQSKPELIVESLKRLGVPKDAYLVRRVPHHEVPEYLRAADIGLSFVKPSYSKLASSPTKIAEYLASGLPIICNAGIGDLDVLIEGDRVGVLVRELNAGHYENALRRVDGLLREGQVSSRCRASAASRFDLESIGGERYCRLYHRLLGSPEHALAGAVDR